ncbi:recombinase family protein [Rhodococcus ruber]|uniref:recombinase family protein n=1 Tax=Rhodococcus ruber TaxID=1830 RepID=UPI00177F852D|nr:recombinase family protein [Rhodococcus ruber]MBD8056873.1 recombinase family protein [Rhodococcus ruber]
MRAVIYCRVSSDTSGRGRSVQEQELECRRVCERNGWTVAEVLIDNDMGASRWSKGDNRPAYQRLPDVLQPGDVLVYWEPSRTGRDLRTYVDLRDLCADRGVLWSYSGHLLDPSKGEDRFRTGLDALLAEKEAEQVRERVLRAHRANVDAGKAHGRIPYGYKAVRDIDTGKIIDRIPHPEQAPIVQEIVKRMLDGESLWAITRDLNNRGVPTATGGKWRASIVTLMLKRPTYIGMRTHKGKITGKGNWEGIIDPEDFERVQVIISDPRRRTNPGPEPKHLLSGIAVCGICGAKMHRLKNNGYPAYACSSKNGCVYRSVSFADEVVTEIVLERLNNPAMFAPVGDDESERKSAVAELDELNARWESLAEQFAEGDISAAMLAKLEKKLQVRIDDAKRRSQPKALDPLLEQFVGPSAREVWEASTTTVLDRRQIVQLVCESVTILPVGKDRRGHLDPESVAVVLR